MDSLEPRRYPVTRRFPDPPPGITFSRYPVREQQYVFETDLLKTELLLKQHKSSQSRAASQCQAWVDQREKTIETVRGLEKKLNNLHTVCNVAHNVGSAMEVIGGLTMIAGSILSVCGHKEIGEFLTKKVSPATGGAGFATTLSSNMAELGLTHTTMNKVKMVLKKDEECTKMLKVNLERSKNIDSYLRRIFSCSVLSNTFIDVVRLCQEGISLMEVGVLETSKLMDELKVSSLLKASKSSDISECVETVIQNVYSTMKKISANPKVRKTLWNICDIIQQSPSSIEFIKLGLKTSIEVCDILKVDVFTGALGFGLLQTSASVMATKCLLGTVLVAVKLISVISNAMEEKDEKSKYSKMLEELNLALTIELNSVRKNIPKLH